jgi:hypothetical protein
MTTREQRLRELCDRWRTLHYVGFDKDYKQGLEDGHDKCADELDAILDETVGVSDSMLRRACDAYDEHQASLAGYAIPMAMHAAINAALKEPGQ